MYICMNPAMALIIKILEVYVKYGLTCCVFLHEKKELKLSSPS